MSTTHIKPCPWCLLRLAAPLLLSSVMLLQGCVVLLGVQAAVGVIGGTAVLTNPDMELIPKTEVSRETLAYPIALVFATLEHTVERNGRKIIEPLAASYALRVSYPFSLLTNNWGGVITVTCIPEGQDTTIVILGSGRDPVQRLEKIGVEIFHDVRIALSRPAETQ